MDRLFLDANVLFSAAHRSDSRLTRLWNLPNAELLTSAYAVEEAQRNLEHSDQRIRLERLLRSVRVVGGMPRRKLPRPAAIESIQKDQTIADAVRQKALESAKQWQTKGSNQR